jgi:hypothetical protein
MQEDRNSIARRELDRREILELLERLAFAESLTDVNIAAGIALNALVGVDD